MYSTFAGGWPGVGLLLIRLVLGFALIVPLGLRLFAEPSMFETLGAALLVTAGTLLMVGLWTPVAGATVALIEIWKMATLPAEKWNCLLMGTVGAALAMLGLGLWSVDARRYGWRRIETTSSRRTG